jgi:UDP-glucose 4-epimerase
MSKLKPERRILISGASGNIGTSLVSSLVSKGNDVTLLTTKPAAQLNRDVLNKKVRVIELTDWSNIPRLQLDEVDVFVHLSGQTSSYVARNDIEKDLETNLMSLVRIIRNILMNQNSIKKVILASSMTQYGHVEALPIDERFPVSSPTYYEMAKNFNEVFITRVAEEKKIDCYNFLRLANIYGGSNQVQANRGFIDRSIAQAVRGEPLYFFGSGEFIRDYIFIDDVVEAFEKSIEIDTPNYSGPYNVGTGVGSPIKEVLQTISRKTKELFNLDVPVLGREFSDNAYEIERRNSVTNSALFKLHTDWEYKTSVDAGVSRVMERYTKS